MCVPHISTVVELWYGFFDHIDEFKAIGTFSCGRVVFYHVCVYDEQDYFGCCINVHNVVVMW